MSLTEHRASSRTAQMVAAFRGRASARPLPICRDPFALSLAGDEGLALAADFERHFPSFELWMAVRTAYIDAHVEHWTAAPHAFPQVVLLGAGLDTRAARLAREGVRFFEVDHPSSQADKHRRLAAIPDYPRETATYVSCDFERQDFVARLLEAHFQPDLPTLFIWEGVVPYLSEEAVRGTLSRIATATEPRSVVVFDYVMRKLAERRALREEDTRGIDYLVELGEPVRFGINDPLPLLYEAGFRHVRTLSFDQAALTLTGSYERERLFRFQHIATASRTVHGLL